MKTMKHLPAFSKLSGMSVVVAFYCCKVGLLLPNSIIILHLYDFHPHIPLCVLWIPPVESSILNQLAKAPFLKREERLRVAIGSLICDKGICSFSVSSFEDINY